MLGTPVVLTYLVSIIYLFNLLDSIDYILELQAINNCIKYTLPG